jgi:hypothetical protein
MLAIILSTCLVNEPAVCRDQRILLASAISALQCVMNAPPYVAKWSEEHPRWRVVRWECRPANQNDI